MIIRYQQIHPVATGGSNGIIGQKADVLLKSRPLFLNMKPTRLTKVLYLYKSKSAPAGK